MDTVTSYIYSYQQKMVFNTYTANKIKKAYKLFLLARMVTIFSCTAERQAFGSLRISVKQQQQENEAIKKAVSFCEAKIKSKHKSIFLWLKRQALGHHQGFARLIHIENVFLFYRQAYAFAAIKRVYTAEKYTAMHRYLEDQGNVLKERQENLANTQNTRKGCEQDLLNFFGKFVTH